MTLSSPQLEFRKFDAQNEILAQRILFQDAFPETSGTPVETVNYYRWKFHSKPFFRDSLECAAWRENEILGYYAGIALDYNIGTAVASCSLICDVMTHSKARGLGIFTKIGRFSLNELQNAGVDFALGYPVRPEVFPGHYKVGWKKAFDLPVYLRLICPSKIFKNNYIQFFLKPLDLIVQLGHYLQRFALKATNGKNLRIEQVELAEFTSELETTFPLHNTAEQYSNYLVKSSRFYKWRLSSPGSRYDLFLLKDSFDKTQGWAIGKRTKIKGLWFWALLDFHSSQEDWATQLITFANISRFCAHANVVGIATMMSKASAKEYAILGALFVRIPYKFTLIYKNLSNKFSDDILSNEKKWNLMWIDTDDL